MADDMGEEIEWKKKITPWERCSGDCIESDSWEGPLPDGSTGYAHKYRIYADIVFDFIFLPPNSSLRLNNYRVDSWDDFNKFYLYETEGIFVNGSTPFEDYVPYDPTCGKDLVVEDTEKEVSPPDWDEEKMEPALEWPEKPRYLTVGKPQKHVLKFRR